MLESLHLKLENCLLLDVQNFILRPHLRVKSSHQPF